MVELEGWHDLFVMVGGASAALVGLLFVAASLHARMLAADGNRHVRALAVHALLSYLILLLLSVFMLLPDQTSFRLGLQLDGLGVVMLVWTLLLVRTVQRAKSPNGPRHHEWLRTYIVSVLIGAGFLAIGAGMAANVDIIGWLPALVMALLLMAVLTSWDLLLRIPGGQ